MGILSRLRAPGPLGEDPSGSPVPGVPNSKDTTSQRTIRDMNARDTQWTSWGRRSAAVLMLGLSVGALSACDSLLEVDLPAQLTNEALTDPAGAETQINSVISLFECAYSAYSWQIMGNEDVMETIAGVASGSHQYYASAGNFQGDCDSDSEDNDWYNQMHAARALAGDLYQKLDEDWTVQQVPQKEEFMAIASIYSAAVLDHFGEVFCEMALDEGPLLTPGETLQEASNWLDRADTHIANAGGDFELPYGITGNDDGLGAAVMVDGLRARVAFYSGDLAGAATAAQNVPQGYVAWVTREQGPQRRNKVYDAATAVGFGGMIGPNTWWSGNPNPATGQDWASPIPFTGYIFLGIMSADGRAVDDNGYPIVWAEQFRAEGQPPTPLNNGAEADTRIPHFKKSIQGPEPREVPAKYDGEDDDIAYVNWKEMVLIRAVAEADAGNAQNAIDLVNVLRDDAGLPEVTYLDDTATDQELRYMITEEWRRALWLEGRYYPYKIQNTDLLWFPRAQGASPLQGYAYGGAVRLLMPQSEFQLNPNLAESGGLDLRGTGCDDLPGSQVPVF